MTRCFLGYLMTDKNELFLKFTDYCSKKYADAPDKTAFLNKYNGNKELNMLIAEAERENDTEKIRDLLKKAISLRR